MVFCNHNLLITGNKFQLIDNSCLSFHVLYHSGIFSHGQARCVLKFSFQIPSHPPFLLDIGLAKPVLSAMLSVSMILLIILHI